MSNAILTSCQYQNYRRIDLIVIHCSATRATQRYTMDDCRRDHRARVVGHRDLPGVKKDCPCFEV